MAVSNATTDHEVLDQLPKEIIHQQDIHFQALIFVRHLSTGELIISVVRSLSLQPRHQTRCSNVLHQLPFEIGQWVVALAWQLPNIPGEVGDLQPVYLMAWANLGGRTVGVPLQQCWTPTSLDGMTPQQWHPLNIKIGKIIDEAEAILSLSPYQDLTIIIWPL